MENQKTIILGAEYDGQLIKTFNHWLLKEGAVFMDKIEGIAGSQDYISYDVSLGKSIIKVEIETYMGVSITGDESTIDYINIQIAKANQFKK